MRELTVDMFVSLDGFTAGADGGQDCFRPYFGPEFGGYVQRVLDEPQLMIMGRVTYDVLAAFWPTATGEPATRMNSLPKLVFSNTPIKEPLRWNNARLARATLADEIGALKRKPGDPLRTIGSVSLVKQLRELGLVDRLRLLVFPVLLGTSGRKPMFDGYEETKLQLAASSVLDSGVVALEYRPAERATESDKMKAGVSAGTA